MSRRVSSSSCVCMCVRLCLHACVRVFVCCCSACAMTIAHNLSSSSSSVRRRRPGSQLRPCSKYGRSPNRMALITSSVAHPCAGGGPAVQHGGGEQAPRGAGRRGGPASGGADGAERAGAEKRSEKRPNNARKTLDNYQTCKPRVSPAAIARCPPPRCCPAAAISLLSTQLRPRRSQRPFITRPFPTRPFLTRPFLTGGVLGGLVSALRPAEHALPGGAAAARPGDPVPPGRRAQGEERSALSAKYRLCSNTMALITSDILVHRTSSL